MNWLIIKTDFRKEIAVATQIGKKNFEVWVPAEKVRKRNPAGRRHMDRSNVVKLQDRPICPSLLFAAVPIDQIDRIMGIRHLTGIEQTFDGSWAVVPNDQIKVFKDAIDAENLAMQMLTAAQQRKRKKRWVALGDAVEQLVAVVKGTVEQAA